MLLPLLAPRPHAAHQVLELMGGLFLVNKKWRSNSMLELTDVLGERRKRSKREADAWEQVIGDIRIHGRIRKERDDRKEETGSLL